MKKTRTKAVFVACYWLEGERGEPLVGVRVTVNRTIVADYVITPSMGSRPAAFQASFEVIDNIVGCPLEPAARDDGLFLFMSARPRWPWSSLS